jgi:hypothetical protein
MLKVPSFQMKWVMSQPWSTAVESSCEVNMKPPSPEREITFWRAVASVGDWRREAAMAQGRAGGRL